MHHVALQIGDIVVHRAVVVTGGIANGIVGDGSPVIGGHIVYNVIGRYGLGCRWNKYTTDLRYWQHPIIFLLFEIVRIKSEVPSNSRNLFFLGPLGLDSGRLTTPFRKWVSSNLSKETNDPNPSPTGKIWFGPYWFGAANRARTGTQVSARDFKSLVSTNSTIAAY